VALGLPRLQSGVSLAKGIVAFMGTHAGDVAATVGAEGGDDVVGAPVVEGLRVRGDRRARARVDFGAARRGVNQKPRSRIGLSKGATLTVCTAGSS
jgi:hypothetical protein